MMLEEKISQIIIKLKRRHSSGRCHKYQIVPQKQVIEIPLKLQSQPATGKLIYSGTTTRTINKYEFNK